MSPRSPLTEARNWRYRSLAPGSRCASRNVGGVSPKRFSEDELVERPAIELLAELGWDTVNAREDVVGPDGTLGRNSRHDVVLERRLLPALRAQNPDAPDIALEE